MDDRMLDGDKMLWFIGGSPERAREALRDGHAWTPEQRAQLEQMASSAGYSSESTRYPSAQQPAPASGVSGGAFASDGAYTSGYGADSGVTRVQSQPSEPSSPSRRR